MGAFFEGRLEVSTTARLLFYKERDSLRPLSRPV